MDEIERTYQEFWKPIVENPDGSLNFEQVKKELFDYANQMREWSKALCELTNGKLSKTNYKAETMISEISGTFEDMFEDKDKADG